MTDLPIGSSDSKSLRAERPETGDHYREQGDEPDNSEKLAKENVDEAVF